MAIASETELYAPVKQFLEGLGYTVKGEVVGCDLVAVKPELDGRNGLEGETGDQENAGQFLIVELKKTFNFPLLMQALDRLQLCDNVYVAVERNDARYGPYKLSWREYERLCRRIGIGLITVKFYKSRRKPAVELRCEPEPYKPRRRTRQAGKLLQEFRERSGDYNVGGSTGRKLVTSYREQALRMALHLSRSEGPLSPRELKALAGSGKAASILQQNYYGWFRRVSRGQYELTPQGEADLAKYREVVDNLEQE